MLQSFQQAQLFVEVIDYLGFSQGMSLPTGEMGDVIPMVVHVMTLAKSVIAIHYRFPVRPARKNMPTQTAVIKENMRYPTSHHILFLPHKN